MLPNSVLFQHSNVAYNAASYKTLRIAQCSSSYFRYSKPSQSEMVDTSYCFISCIVSLGRMLDWTYFRIISCKGDIVSLVIVPVVVIMVLFTTCMLDLKFFRHFALVVCIHPVKVS